MKTQRLIALSVAFLGCSLCLSAQKWAWTISIAIAIFQSRWDARLQCRNELGAWDNRSVSGTVQDNQNNALKDVRVELTDANGTSVGSAYTGPSGHFEFTRLSPGSYTVIATSGLAAGFRACGCQQLFQFRKCSHARRG